VLPPAKQVNMAGGGKKNKAEENIYRCKSCLVDSSGILSYLEHINGKAHIRKAGRIGFSGLLPNGGPATSGSPALAPLCSRECLPRLKRRHALQHQHPALPSATCPLVSTGARGECLTRLKGRHALHMAHVVLQKLTWGELMLFCFVCVEADAGIIPRLPDDPRDPFANSKRTEPTEEEKSSVSMGISRNSEQLLREALISHDKDRKQRPEDVRQEKEFSGVHTRAGGRLVVESAGEQQAPEMQGILGAPSHNGLLGAPSHNGQPNMMPMFRSGIGRPPPRAPSDRFAAMRVKLPVYQWKAELLEAIEVSQVVVIQGETGCGKTTQVPHYVLEAAAEMGRPCNVVCTQPRRISAIGVASRVAEERGEPCGRTVGYSIRHEACWSRDTMLLFCTTGTLLRRLEGDPMLRQVSHVFVDEVHERGLESDFLLLALKDMLARRPDLKVILMSATMDADRFSTYFGGAPIFKVPGRTFPVQTLYLEDAFKITGHRMDPRAEWSRTGGGWRKSKSSSALSILARSSSPTGENGEVDDPRPLSEKFDWELQERELAMRYGRNYGAQVIRNMMIFDPDQVNYQLIADLICSDVLFQMRGGNHGSGARGGGQQGRFRGGHDGQKWQENAQWQGQVDNWMQMNMMQQHIQQGMHGGKQGMPGMSQGLQGMMQHGMLPMGMGQGNMPNFQNPCMMQHGIMGMQVFFFFACM